MKLVEIHQIKRGELHFDEIDELCFKSKNLFNSALYAVRQHFFETGKYLNFYSVDKICKETNQADYRALPSQVSQQTLHKSRNGKLINADLNGSLNILKKAVVEFQYPIEVCGTPCVITLRWTK